jgi:hypothetical protein
MQIVMSMEYTANVSPAYEGMATREHAMSAPGGDAHGDSGGRSRYGVSRPAAKSDGCACCRSKPTGEQCLNNTRSREAHVAADGAP